jgi:putative transposase
LGKFITQGIKLIDDLEWFIFNGYMNEEPLYMRRGRGGFRGRHLVLGERGYYHVMSRMACSQYLMDEAAKQMFVRMLRKQAVFCGLDILNYCVMGNHFHLLISVPEKVEISDAELLQRYRALYDPERCPPSAPKPSILEGLLADGSADGAFLRERIVARMGDLSVFMRELKQRFVIWYNRKHGNKGTIWSQRFTSVIVEPTREALSTVAAYIDLNPVRAKLVMDPAEYAFSSYGQAVAGNVDARRGYEAVFCGYLPWKQLFPNYNLILYGKGAQSKGLGPKDQGVIETQKLQQVVDAGGRLPLSQVLRLRVRYMTAGTALGSAEFLRKIDRTLEERGGHVRQRSAYCMRGGDWGGLMSYRNLQLNPVHAG